jgi:DNA-binding CsgD family transcriptional regulator
MDIAPRKRRVRELLDRRYEWTPRQRQVLDLVARGRSNAEVAEALGISLDGAKWHMREILAKLGVDTREEAAEYWRQANRPAARLGRLVGAIGGVKFAAAGAAGVGVVAVAAVVALRLFLASGEPAPLAALPAPPAASPVASIAVLPGFTAPATIAPDGAQWLKAGRLFRVGSGPDDEGIAAIQYHEAVTSVVTGREAVITYGTPNVPWTENPDIGSNRGVFLFVQVDGRRFRVTVWAPGDSSGESFIKQPYSAIPPPDSVLTLSVTDDVGTKFSSLLDAVGNLYLSASPLRDVAVNELNGREIQFATSIRLADFHPRTTSQSLGTWAAPWWLNTCGANVCQVSTRVSNFMAPVAGSLECVSPSRLTITSPDLVLQVETIDTGIARATFPCDRTTVAAGDVLVTYFAHYLISAATLDGRPLSVAATGAGDLLVGDATVSDDCPCIQLN